MYTFAAITVHGPTWNDIEAPPDKVLDYTQPLPGETSRREWFQPLWNSPEDIPIIFEYPAERTPNGDYCKTFFRVVEVPQIPTFLDRLPPDSTVTFRMFDSSDCEDEGFELETSVSEYREVLKSYYLKKIEAYNGKNSFYTDPLLPIHLCVSGVGNRFLQIDLEGGSEPLSDKFTFTKLPGAYIIRAWQPRGNVIEEQRKIAENVALLLQPLFDTAV